MRPVRDRGVELAGPAAATRRATPPVVRRQGLRMLRRWSEATASQRVLPDFVVIGTKRGGTSTLFGQLRQHPQVAMPLPPGGRFKGTYYFDRHYDLGEGWYRAWFPLQSTIGRRAERLQAPVLVGEACPYYLTHPDAARRVATALPRARVVVLLREPAARAFSHYRANCRRGLESLPFEEALEREDERLRVAEREMALHPSGYSPAHEHLSYRTQGMYAVLLARWLQYFPREQVLVLASEDLYANVAETVDRVTDFLGLRLQHVQAPEQVNAAPAATMSEAVAASLARTYRAPNRDLARLLGGWEAWQQHGAWT